MSRDGLFSARSRGRAFSALVLAALLLTAPVALPAAASDASATESFWSLLLDVFGLGQDDAAETENPQPDPLPSMGFEIEPNG